MRKSKEKLQEIQLDKSSLIKLPDGTEIKIWFYQDGNGKTQTYTEATNATKKANFFVQLDLSGAHICWNRKTLEDRKHGFVTKDIIKDVNAVSVIYDFESKNIVQMCAVPLPKNFKKT